MIKRWLSWSGLGLAVGMFLSFPAQAAEPLLEMSAALHVHTRSSGPNNSTLDEIAIRARGKGVDAVILTDYFKQRVELGLYPFHKILKVWFEKPSISRYGFQRYFRELAQAQKKYPDVLLLAGAEVAPAYWWSGSLFKNNLTVNNLQKNLLVFGLYEDDMKEIPTVSNHKVKADAYHKGREGERPYQEVIDYAQGRGGFAVWSTPDENPATTFKKGPVRFRTDPYAESLRATQGAAGVCIIPEGHDKTGLHGGLWDRTLLQYTQGRRKTPPWVFAELIMHVILPIDLDHRLNVAWVRGKNESELFEAFRKGRFYAVSRGRTDRLKLEDFSVQNNEGEIARSGEELYAQGMISVRSRLSIHSSLVSEIKVKLIRMGKMVRETSGGGDVLLTYEEDLALSETPKIYYRIEAHSPEPELSYLLSNPIFVVKKSEKN